MQTLPSFYTDGMTGELRPAKAGTHNHGSGRIVSDGGYGFPLRGNDDEK